MRVWSWCLLLCFSRSTEGETSSFAQIFKDHTKEVALRDANVIEIYDREFSYYRHNTAQFPQLKLMQLGDNLSYNLKVAGDIGGGGMLEMYNAYFNTSHPTNRTIISVHYNASTCDLQQDTQYTDSILCRDDTVHTISNYLSSLLLNLPTFTIVIDVNRPEDVSIGEHFMKLLRSVEPDGLLIVENLKGYYRQSKVYNDIKIENDMIKWENDRLSFFKGIIDLVNSIHILELGYYQKLTLDEKYCASWIKQITFNDGVVIVHKRKLPDLLYKTLMTGKALYDVKDDYRKEMIIYGERMGYFKNTKSMWDPSALQKLGERRFMGTGEIDDKGELLYYLDISSDSSSQFRFEFLEWDVNTNILHQRATDFCIQHRLYSIQARCEAYLVENAVKHLKSTFNQLLADITRGKYGLEIGGSSQSAVPIIYQQTANIDNVIYSSTNLWTNFSTDTYIVHPHKIGKLFVHDAVDLSSIRSDVYDYVFASHCLEHIANPLRALIEWFRVVKTNGYIVLILPLKSKTFDHKRKISPFSTLLQKYRDKVGEDDLSTLPEILELHDLSLDLAAGNIHQFTARSLQNFENRALHHYVYDPQLLRELCDYIHNCQFVQTMTEDYNIWFIMQKVNLS